MFEEGHNNIKETHYVINSAALDFMELPEIESDDEKNRKEKTDDKGSQTQQNVSLVSSTSIKNILLLLVAVFAGGALGSAYVSSQCTPPASAPQATTTPNIPAVSIPAPIVPVSTMVSTLSSNTPASTGVATSSLPVEPGKPATTTPSSDGLSATSSDGGTP